ncbi:MULTISPECIES: HNH endonuclease signature motif containing protein [unclassified Leucobacter]|uniref:HNH endonuclease signature motif containing protein n=1 Tax=unclassified Leucobacter TaxID=2621730 RepID=UPI00165E5684|nr:MULTISPECIES: HNH endonuclease signature motif containing protein [unclassified Leucobacter]MBC9926295.1 DUF222 domain-containing protein [Leucobacter sp. cx-169]
MEFITSLEQQLAAVRQLVGEVPEASSLPEIVRALSDADVVAVLEATSALSRSVERLQIAASGVVAWRSTRESGHAGIAQALGHRNPVSLVQQITGASRVQAMREVRVGQSLLESAAGVGPAGAAADIPRHETPVTPWHAPIDRALLAGSITSDHHDAIHSGLGQPPVPTEADVAAIAAAAELDSLAARCQAATAMSETWSLAAEHLIAEAGVRTLEELRKAARAVRDELDPVGAERRFTDRYEARSFRIWIDAQGAHHGAFTFDDESAAWVKSLIDAALRPRRGGPRFVDPEEKARADELREDPRSNEQLTHDLMIDVLRSGTLATVSEVFGARQAGVRVVTVTANTRSSGFGGSDNRGNSGNTGNSDSSEDSAGSEGAGVSDRARFEHAFLELDGAPVPLGVADRAVCNTGTVSVTVDPLGNPLDVGREQRLFTTKQRIALSIRDGGCRWSGCDSPATHCEAHHIDEWAADQGRTDIDRGILLCRFHHMQLHHNGWRITRDRTGTFLLHPPPGHRTSNAVELPIRVIRLYAWGTLPQPSVRFRPGESAPPQQVRSENRDRWAHTNRESVRA